MKMFAQLTGAAALGFAMMASVPAQATQIIASTTGLASPASTITFDEIVLPTFTIVTNQYAGLGVTFSPGLDYSPQTGFGNVQGADVGNFDASGGKIDGPQTLTFSSVLTGAAFAVASNNSAYLFEALLGGAVVDSFTATVPGNNLHDFYGFSDESFDSIRLTSLTSDFYLVDHIQLGAGAVPEPATWAILLVGFGLTGAALRRRVVAAA